MRDGLREPGFEQRKFDQEPPMVIDPSKRYSALMETTKGAITSFSSLAEA